MQATVAQSHIVGAIAASDGVYCMPYSELCSGIQGILRSLEANTPLTGKGGSVDVASAMSCVIGGDRNWRICVLWQEFKAEVRLIR